MTGRVAGLGALALGAAAVVAATLVGQDQARLDAIVNPPALIRAALVGGSAALAVILLSRGLARLGLPAVALDADSLLAALRARG